MLGEIIRVFERQRIRGMWCKIDVALRSIMLCFWVFDIIAVYLEAQLAIGSGIMLVIVSFRGESRNFTCTMVMGSRKAGTIFYEWPARTSENGRS